MPKSTKSNQAIKLIVWILVVETIGALSGMLAGDIQEKYNSLQLPVLSPPDVVFGPVWIILYLLIGVCGFLIMRDSQNQHQRLVNLSLFSGQLLANFLWSLVFFGGNYYWLGVGIILILDGLVISCIITFKKINRLAMYLLIPYLIWILFATYLTIGVAILN